MSLDFEHLLGLHTGERRDYLTICEIDPLVAAAIGAATTTVFLSHHTIQKQLNRHKELPISIVSLNRAWHSASIDRIQSAQQSSYSSIPSSPTCITAATSKPLWRGMKYSCNPFCQSERALIEPSAVSGRKYSGRI
jgi:hypothetical protein